jgi:hypothetical protein
MIDSDRIASLSEDLRMSLDAFVNMYRAYAYFRCCTRFITRQPSEWIRPRSICFGYAAAMSFCHDSGRYDVDASDRTRAGETHRALQ